MKKRGFTLVELLAVIGILAVILILAVPKVNNYILSSKKETFINNALNVARQLEYDNMDFITFDRAYLKDFDLKKVNRNDIDVENSLVYVEDNEIYIDLVGIGSYEGFYACHVGSDSKNVVVQNTACGTSTDGLIYIDFEVDLDGGKTTQHYNSQYASGNYLNLQIPTKEEFTFNGWQLVNGNSVLSGNRIRFGTEATKIKAFWKAHPTLTVNNEGTTTQIFKEKYPGGTVIRLEKPIREGYVFKEWQVVSGNSVISGNILTIGSEDTTIKANWQIGKVNINYNLNGGTAGASAPTEGEYGSTVTVSNPSKTGYTFAGWDVSGKDASIDDTNLTIGTSDITLSAKWNINTYTITYNLDGGAFENDMPTEAEYGSTIILEKPIKEGYVFVGWSVTSGSGVVSGNTFTMGSADTTIKALWKKAQALYTESDNTLTFILSDHEYSVGETYNSKAITNVYTGFDTEIYHPEQTTSEGDGIYAEGTVDTPWVDISTFVKTVKFVDVITPISTAGWFFGFENCEFFDVTKLDVSQVEDMEYMFQLAGYYPETVEFIGLDSWDTSNVIDMNHLFHETAFKATSFSIDLSKWDTSSVTDMSVMFRQIGDYATTWSIGDLSTKIVTREDGTTYTAWDVSNVTNMSYVFAGACERASVCNLGNLESWNTSSVTNMRGLLAYTGYSATTFNIGDLSSWDTSNVTNMQSMFQMAGYSATTFNIGNLSSWNTSNVTDMRWMFQKTGYTATTFNIGDLSKWDTGNVTNMRTMFSFAGYTATTFNIGDLSNWNTSNVTDMAYMFEKAGYSATYSLDLSSWNVNKVTSYKDFNLGVTGKVTAPTWVN